MTDFIAKMRGRFQVPPVITEATGITLLKLRNNGLSLKFLLKVNDIENVTQAHIHLGRPGQNGPVVAFLFGPSKFGITSRRGIVEGTLTREDLVGPLQGDEILGPGGTIKKLVTNGYKVISVVVAKGRKEKEDCIKESMLKANQYLGVEKVVFLEYPNLLLETLPLHSLTKEIEALLAKYEPSMIFTHHYGDVNRDHQILYQAVITSARPLPKKMAAQILCFETVSSSEWSQHTNDKELNQTILQI